MPVTARRRWLAAGSLLARWRVVPEGHTVPLATCAVRRRALPRRAGTTCIAEKHASPALGLDARYPAPTRNYPTLLFGNRLD